MSLPVILLLAGGASRRMRGRDKLLEDVGGEPLLRRQVRRALATGAPVIVALPAAAGARRAVLNDLPARILTLPEARHGMGHTLAAAARAAPEAAALLVMLADMPEIGTQELNRLIAAHRAGPDAVLRGAAEDGRPGHPVLFPARLRPKLLTLTGDAGARDVLAGETVGLVPLPGRAALTDLDTPEDWAAWQAGDLS